MSYLDTLLNLDITTNATKNTKNVMWKTWAKINMLRADIDAIVKEIEL